MTRKDDWIKVICEGKTKRIYKPPVENLGDFKMSVLRHFRGRITYSDEMTFHVIDPITQNSDEIILGSELKDLMEDEANLRKKILKVHVTLTKTKMAQGLAKAIEKAVIAKKEAENMVV